LAEIEPAPCALLAHHYPDVPNLGDMTKIADMLYAFEIEAPDVFCGGTPCQAFSVAGLRKSLDDARGNLSLTFCEIANAIDTIRTANGQEPAIVFWENVPGVLNTKDNAFGCLLAGLAGEDDPLEPPGGRWTNAGYVHGPQRTVAWRILDAQFSGVAQRRRRVFVVASARAGFDPAAVLFEFDGVRRDTAPSREAGKAAPTIPSRSTAGGGLGTDFDCDGGLIETTHRMVAFGEYSDDGSASATKARDYKDAADLVVLPFDTTQVTSASNYSNPKPGDPCHPLAAGAHAPAVAFKPSHYTRGKDGAPSEVVAPLSADADKGDQESVVAYTTKLHNTTSNQSGKVYEEYTVGLDSNSPPPALLTAMAVRRLTPTECERLQGFPDNYTLVPNRGKPMADGPRYKALGNSWAVPVVRWIGARIQKEVERASA
jgi:DNA (cytosine-5)-methyltransferase 1